MFASGVKGDRRPDTRAEHTGNSRPDRLPAIYLSSLPNAWEEVRGADGAPHPQRRTGGRGEEEDAHVPSMYTERGNLASMYTERGKATTILHLRSVASDLSDSLSPVRRRRRRRSVAWEIAEVCSMHVHGTRHPGSPLRLMTVAEHASQLRLSVLFNGLAVL
eukprot:gene17486-biopygen11533